MAHIPYHLPPCTEHEAALSIEGTLASEQQVLAFHTNSSPITLVTRGDTQNIEQLTWSRNQSTEALEQNLESLAGSSITL